MKRRSLATLVERCSSTIPLAALAIDHSRMEGMDGGIVMLGDQTVDGVKAIAHLKDIR